MIGASIDAVCYQYSFCIHLFNSKFSGEFTYRSKSVVVALEMPKRTLCHWHLHIYIAKRGNVIIYSCHLAVFVKEAVLTRSNSLVSTLIQKGTTLKCIFASMKEENAWNCRNMANPPWNKGPVQSTSTSISYARKRYLFMCCFLSRF